MPEDTNPHTKGEEPEDDYESKLQELLDKVGVAAKIEVPDPANHAEIDSKLSNIENRGRDAQRSYQKHFVQNSGEVSTGTAVGFAVAYNMVGCVLGGGVLGWAYDRATHGTFIGVAIGTVVGAFVGITSAIILILKKGGRTSS